MKNVATEIRKKRTVSWKGFTLAELIVVITILAILATVGFLALSGYSQDAKDSAIRANVRSVQTAISSESALTNNSPRYYVVHDTGAALSGAFVYADGNQTALTGGDWNVSGTNYSAGNPDYAKLKMNPEKFRVSGSGLPGTLGVTAWTAGFDGAGAAYDSRYLTVGAMDALAGSTSGGKKRSVSYFQVAGISPATGTAVVAGNYPSSSGSVAGLVKDPEASGSTGALVDGANSSLPPAPVNGVCGTASKGYAFSASSFGSDTFCPSGAAPTPASPAFPTAGNSVSWTCPGQNGGSSASCSASHAAWANCSASTQTVNAHSYSLSAFNNGNTLAGTSAAVTVTGGTQTYSQTFLCTDGTVSTSGSETAGTVTCSAAGYALIGGSCVPNSCLSIKNAYPASADGTYSVDPDGAGAGFAATNVYCDMTTSGGGWTLVSWNKGTSNTVWQSFFIAASNTANLANKNLANTSASINAEGFSNAVNTSAAMLKSAAYSASPIVDNATGKWNYDSTRCGATLSHSSRTAGCAGYNANDDYTTADRFNISIGQEGIVPYWLASGNELCYSGHGWCDFEFYLR